MKNFKKLYLIFISLVLISVSILYSCGANIFSLEDDVKFGQDIDKEIKARPYEFPLLKNRPDITGYVSTIGKYIINNSPKIQYKNIFPYEFQVINDTIVNAFCTPGGYIYVYTGLMKFIDNEATLAGVLAHEIAHAEKRHMTQRLTSYYGVSIITSIILGNNPSTLAEIMANLFIGIGFLANSRSDEKEADDYSIRYLATTKYYPGAIVFFFKKIYDEQKKKGEVPGALERLLSTHPLAADRVENVYTQLKELKINADSTKGIFFEEYQQFKSKLP